MGGSPSFRVEAFFAVGETPQSAGAYQSRHSIRAPFAGQPNAPEITERRHPMNTQPIRSGRFSGRYTVCGAAILLTLFGVVPVGTFADERPATTAVGIADVSLSDLNLSTPEGMRLARDRLHAMAERLCADHGGSHAPP